MKIFKHGYFENDQTLVVFVNLNEPEIVAIAKTEGIWNLFYYEKEMNDKQGNNAGEGEGEDKTSEL